MKKNGDKVGMRVCSSATTICPMQQPQATPAYISIHVVYNLYWTWLNQSGCIRNAKLKHSYPNGQFLQTQAKLHGTYGGRSWTHPYPYLVPILFSPVHPYILFHFFKFLKCVTFLMAFVHFKIFNLPPPASTLILTSSQFCVFSTPLQAHHQEPKRKSASLNCGSYMYSTEL